MRKKEHCGKRDTRFRTCNAAFGHITIPYHRRLILLVSPYLGSHYEVGPILFFSFGSNSQWPYLYLWKSLWAWHYAGQLSAMAVVPLLHSSFWLLFSLHFWLLNFWISRQITLGVASFGITLSHLIK